MYRHRYKALEEESKPRGYNSTTRVNRHRCRDANHMFSTDGLVPSRRTAEF